MQPNQRQHRTPFRAEGQYILDAHGYVIAKCATERLSRFICIACNYFDRLTKALKLCRGEYDNLDTPENRPAYIELMQLHNEIHPYERELRG